ncbi:MAG: flagellar basal body L-ring protein FlgH [bacterium]
MKRLMAWTLAATSLAALAVSVRAETIVPGGSLFTDHSAIGVGDAITILIVESTEANKSTVTKTRSGTTNELGSGGRLDFLGTWGVNSDNSSIGEGSTSRRGNLQAQITAMITEVTPSGLLLVEGRRSVLVNGEEETIVLRGSVRPEDVRADNTVFSTFLADASIEYKGQGVLATAERPGILSRIFNWIF